MTVIAATLAVAGVGLALTHAVLMARTVDPHAGHHTVSDRFLVAAGWAVMVLSAVRRYPDPPAAHEHTLIAALHAEARRATTHREGRNEH